MVAIACWLTFLEKLFSKSLLARHVLQYYTTHGRTHVVERSQLLNNRIQ